MAINIRQLDFDIIGYLTSHCDQKKLNIAINEAIVFDMRRLFGSFWSTIEANFNSQDPEWKDLIEGSSYGTGNEARRHEGVRDMVVYYAYSRYVVLNGFNDTPTGMVTKTNEFSVPKPLKELNSFADKYRDMAMYIYKDISHFLCKNQSDYPGFRSGECIACEEYLIRDHITGHTIKGKNINKWGV